MSRNVTVLRPKQEEAILALLVNPSVEHAARAVKITPRTLYRWQDEAAFENAYRKARRRAYGQGIARLQQASSAAVSALLKILIDPQTKAATKLRAIELVLSYGAKAIAIEDIDARVSGLELLGKSQSGSDERTRQPALEGRNDVD